MTEPHNPPGTLAFVDVETTGVHPDRRAWEIGVILRHPGAATIEQFHCFIDIAHLELGDADHRALQVGRFHTRHPQMTTRPDVVDHLFGAPVGVLAEYDAMRHVEWLTRGAQLVGWNVTFDAQTFDARLRAMGISPSFDYHHIEVSSLAAGFIIGEHQGRTGGPLPEDAFPRPWSAKTVRHVLGLQEPDADVTHTALGDARWTMEMFDYVIDPQKPSPEAGDRLENLAKLVTREMG